MAPVRVDRVRGLRHMNVPALHARTGLYDVQSIGGRAPRDVITAAIGGVASCGRGCGTLMQVTQSKKCNNEPIVSLCSDDFSGLI